MAVVIGVHGIFQTGSSAEALTRQWRRALELGVAALPAGDAGIPVPSLEVPHLSPLLTAARMRLGPGDDLDDPATLTEQERAVFDAVLDEALADLSSAQIDRLAATAATLTGLPRLWPAQDLRRVSALDGRWRGGGRLVLRLVREVHAYLHRPEVGEQVRRRVRISAGPDTTVVLAHSLGSIIAYDLLRRGELPQVRTLITCGSPLAWATIRLLLSVGQPETGPPAPLVGLVWTNVHDPRDAVTGGLGLNPVWAQISDHQVANPFSDAHGACGYLRHRELASAVLAGVSEVES